MNGLPNKPDKEGACLGGWLCQVELFATSCLGGCREVGEKYFQEANKCQDFFFFF